MQVIARCERRGDLPLFYLPPVPAQSLMFPSLVRRQRAEANAPKRLRSHDRRPIIATRPRICNGHFPKFGGRKRLFDRSLGQRSGVQSLDSALGTSDLHAVNCRGCRPKSQSRLSSIVRQPCLRLTRFVYWPSGNNLSSDSSEGYP